MCGIAGILGKRDDNLIRAMTATLVHRGPDGEGYFSADTFSIGHRRLAIIDIEGGAQPMSTPEARHRLVYNGEIYNHKNLRRELEKDGCVFNSESDTEVLLQLFLSRGVDCLRALHGMYAFAVCDSKDGTCFLARDPLGIKPLYYAEHEGCLYFASEMKALLSVPGMPRELDVEGMDDYLTHLYTMPPRTIYRNIRQIPPGHCAEWRDGKLRVWRHWTLECKDEARSPGEWRDELIARFDQTIKEHLISDVPLGAYLSAGLDSASIVASMSRQHSNAVSTFTIGFTEEGRRYDERVAARILAKHLKSDHNEMIARADVAALLPKVVRHFDEPFGNPTALLSYLIAQQVRKHVKVVLSGDGGDELFAGYPRYAGMKWSEHYRQIPEVIRKHWIHPLIMHLPENVNGLHALRRIREFSSGSFLNPMERYAYWVGHFHLEDKKKLYQEPLAQQLAGRDANAPLLKLAEECGTDDPIKRVMCVDLQTFLPNNVLQYGDRMSMAHGLETRVPFAEAHFAAWAMGMPSNLKLRGLQGKRILREAMSGRLPEDTLRARKQGFNPPMGTWLNGPLRPMLEDCLSTNRIEKRGYFRAEYVRDLLAEHQNGKRDHTWHLWALLVFEVWHQAYLD